MTEFRELPEWEKAHELTVAIYEIARSFPKAESEFLKRNRR
jgi:hypothetical protein